MANQLISGMTQTIAQMVTMLFTAMLLKQPVVMMQTMSKSTASQEEERYDESYVTLKRQLLAKIDAAAEEEAGAVEDYKKLARLAAHLEKYGMAGTFRDIADDEMRHHRKLKTMGNLIRTGWLQAGS